MSIRVSRDEEAYWIDERFGRGVFLDWLLERGILEEGGDGDGD